MSQRLHGDPPARHAVDMAPRSPFWHSLFTARWYPGFKAAVFLLLIANAVVFVVQGTASEGLDSAAWLILLLLLELETAHGQRLVSRSAVVAVHSVRFAAGVAVVIAAIGYVVDDDWLDVANAWTWIAVVVMLEAQIRFGKRLGRYRGAVASVAALVYCALGAMVIAWAWRGEWFEAYDAALWLVAFATIEMNVLRKV